VATRTLSVSDITFDQEVIASSSEKPVLVDFWAEWCGPCKMLNPTLEQIALEKGEKLKIVRVNVDENPHTANNFGVMSIPTMILFREGIAVKQVVGNRPKEQILAQIERFL
jgi:thioredoxin 1